MAKDWSIDFDNKLRAKFGIEVERLEPYVNKRTRIKFKHKCGNEYYAIPCSVLKSKVGACTKCRTKNTGFRGKKTDNDFKAEVKALVGDEYTFLDSYTKAHDKIRCRHNKCGTVWLIKPNAFLNGVRCPNITCIPKKPYKTRAEIEREVRNKTEDQYRMAEPYKGDGEKILFVHRKCGYKWKIKPNDILNDHGCPKCSKTSRWDTKKLKDYIKQVSFGEYELLGEFSTMLKPVKIRHNKCGAVLYMQPSSFKNGHRCYKCAMKKWGENQRITEHQFYNRVSFVLGDEYRVTGFTRRDKEVIVTHKKCGNTWKTLAANTLSGSGCPFCKSSRGERYINNWLKREKISFIPQKKFADCKDQLPLPFDFYLPAYNLIIEYDGRQHFSGSDDYFGGEKAFQIRHKHDLIKNNYCEDNGINLLRIPYTIKGGAIGETIQAKLDELTKLDSIA